MFMAKDYLDSLKNALQDEPQYRLKQVKKAIYQDLLDDWLKATVLPLELRGKLNRIAPLLLTAEAIKSTNKQAVKAVISLNDGLKIETVLMRYRSNRNAVCVSSQVGCTLACLFCATGKMGFKRNLSAWEMVEQVLFFARYLNPDKITSLVYMGMGEPFLNYEEVMKSIRILNDAEGFGLGARHFSVSTAGITEGINRLAEENLEINLAVSLHAPDDNLRSKLMPINKQYPLRQIFRAVDDYIVKTRRKVMFEYMLISGVNDSNSNAEALAKLMQKKLYLVNLITYNPTGSFKAARPQRAAEFKKILERNRVAVTRRYSFGNEIKAACGQLAS